MKIITKMALILTLAAGMAACGSASVSGGASVGPISGNGGITVGDGTVTVDGGACILILCI